MERARAYRSHGDKYVTVHVFSTDITDVELLTRMFGGNYYRHGVGWLWICGSLRDQARIIRKIGSVPETLTLIKERIDEARQFDLSGQYSFIDRLFPDAE